MAELTLPQSKIGSQSARTARISWRTAASIASRVGMTLSTSPKFTRLSEVMKWVAVERLLDGVFVVLTGYADIDLVEAALQLDDVLGGGR